VLTGVDLTSYGPDLPGSPRLGTLVQAILRHVPDLARLRLSSIDSIEADQALVEAVTSEQRLMPHLHLSLQHGADLILKRMKRRHLRADAINFCEAMLKARPDLAFGADLIAGFPTETDAHFAELLTLVEACRLSYVHVFPFSPRQGTPAASMPQLDRMTIKARAAELRAAGEAAFQRHLARVARAKSGDVLIERAGGAKTSAARTGVIGRLPDFTPVRLAGAHDGAHDGALDGAQGAIVAIAISGHDGQMLNGHIIQQKAA
jgi:threonylcarbamoyladenosine tRNA methylthiotransferase MtaB